MKLRKSVKTIGKMNFNVMEVETVVFGVGMRNKLSSLADKMLGHFVFCQEIHMVELKRSMEY